MDDPVGRQLAGAELWIAGPEGPGSPPVLVAGWEDGATFCAAVCATDVGLAFCRRCPSCGRDRPTRGRRPRSAVRSGSRRPEHVQNLIRKLGAADRTQAAITAIRMGLIESED